MIIDVGKIFRVYQSILMDGSYGRKMSAAIILQLFYDIPK